MRAGYLTSPVMEESSSRLPRAGRLSDVHRFALGAVEGTCGVSEAKARKATAAAEASAASSKDAPAPF